MSTIDQAIIQATIHFYNGCPNACQFVRTIFGEFIKQPHDPKQVCVLAALMMYTNYERISCKENKQLSKYNLIHVFSGMHEWCKIKYDHFMINRSTLFELEQFDLNTIVIPSITQPVLWFKYMDRELTRLSDSGNLIMYNRLRTYVEGKMPYLEGRKQETLELFRDDLNQSQETSKVRDELEQKRIREQLESIVLELQSYDMLAGLGMEHFVYYYREKWLTKTNIRIGDIREALGVLPMYKLRVCVYKRLDTYGHTESVTIRTIVNTASNESLPEILPSAQSKHQLLDNSSSFCTEDYTSKKVKLE